MLAPSDRELLQVLARQPSRDAAAAAVGAMGSGGCWVGGAVLLTGATGFVGTGVLFLLLARADELGISRVAVMVRRKRGMLVEERLAELRASPALVGVHQEFDRLVVALEGDVVSENFGWADAHRAWPFEEALRAMVHCAADVSFDQPLAQAAGLISGSLQAAHLAARWGARRFVFVSTAFVHSTPPPPDGVLEESLIDLRGFDAAELYHDARGSGKQAAAAMDSLGFPNTYAFSKAVAEHLVLRACAGEGLDGRIVRPSIVGPAWAMPFPGWAGSKPSTVVLAYVLMVRGGARVFNCSQDPSPVIPVDFVAAAVVEALATQRACGGDGMITQAVVDESEASRMPSFRALTLIMVRFMLLCRCAPRLNSRLMYYLVFMAEATSTFRVLHTVFNVLPAAAAGLARRACALLPCLGQQARAKHRRVAAFMQRLGGLPAMYIPFTCPSEPWHFRSALRLPSDWCALEYCALIFKAVLLFAADSEPRGRAPSTCGHLRQHRDQGGASKPSGAEATSTAEDASCSEQGVSLESTSAGPESEPSMSAGSELEGLEDCEVEWPDYHTAKKLEQ